MNYPPQRLLTHVGGMQQQQHNMPPPVQGRAVAPMHQFEMMGGGGITVGRGVGDGMQADSFYAPVSPAKIEGGGEVALTNSERKAQEKSYKELMRLANRQEESEGVIVGVGISLADIDDRVIIKSIEPGSSAAENGGISEGDQICLLDHVNITGIPADNLATMLLGEDGSVVIISVLKPNEDRYTHATLIRRMDKEGTAGAGSHRKKEIFDIGLSFAVTRDRKIQVTHLVPGGPAAKLGFVSVGDVIVAIDEEPIPLDSHADLGAFVQSRVCGPRGTSVVLTLLKGGLGMRTHVQLRRTNLFGATEIKQRANEQSSSQHRGLGPGAGAKFSDSLGRLEGGIGGRGEAFPSHEDASRGGGAKPPVGMFPMGNIPYDMDLFHGKGGVPQEVDPVVFSDAAWAIHGGYPPSPPDVQIMPELMMFNAMMGWKEAPWRQTLDPAQEMELHRAVSEALSDVAAGGISAYGMFLVPNHAQELWIKILNKNGAAANSGLLQQGDVLMQIGRNSIRSVPFDRISHIFSSHWSTSNSIALTFSRPVPTTSGNFVLGPPIHVTLEVPSAGQEQQQQQQQQQNFHYHHHHQQQQHPQSQQHQQPSSQGGSLQQIGNNYQGARIAGASSQMAQSRIIQSQQSVPTQQMQQLNLTEGGGRQPSNSAYPPPPPFTLRV